MLPPSRLLRTKTFYRHFRETVSEVCTVFDCRPAAHTEIKCLILENVLLNCALTGLNICGVLIYGDIYIFHAVASFQPCGNGSNLLLGRFLCDNCSQSPGHLEYSGLLLQSPLCPNSAPPISTKDIFLLNKRVCRLIHIHWHRKGCEKSFHR